MSTFRNFDPGIEQIAISAAEDPFLEGGFRQEGQASNTADGAFLVELPSIGRRAFAKPANNHDKAWQTAVHEKLASDLAFDLKLPVPPVHIIAGGEGFAPWLAISHIPFPTPRPFSDRGQAGIAEDSWQPLQPVATAMRVFYTWINDVDHGGHEQNFLFGRPAAGSEVALAFIDHSYSISHTLPARQELAPTVHGLFSNDSHDVMREVASRIEAINRSRIEHLVHRLKRLLPEGVESRLVDLIVDGRETVRKAVEKKTGGT